MIAIAMPLLATLKPTYPASLFSSAPRSQRMTSKLRPYSGSVARAKTPISTCTEPR